MKFIVKAAVNPKDPKCKLNLCSPDGSIIAEISSEIYWLIPGMLVDETRVILYWQGIVKTSVNGIPKSNTRRVYSKSAKVNKRIDKDLWYLCAKVQCGMCPAYH